MSIIFLITGETHHSQTAMSTSKSCNLFDDLPALKPPAATELRDELNRYLSTDQEHVTDAIVWWHERKTTYPRLHCMALDYLTIPGMS